MESLNPNNYNPNRVFSPEMNLLKISLLSCGWTQPIVVQENHEIVDGYHRYQLARFDEDVRSITDGLVPVVYLDARSPEDLMMDTVRHNRARGQHGILKMGEIVRALVDAGYGEDYIADQLQMEGEEVERLSNSKSVTENQGKDSFGRGWVPTRRDDKG